MSKFYYFILIIIYSIHLMMSDLIIHRSDSAIHTNTTLRTSVIIVTLGTMLERVSRSFSSAIVVRTALGLLTTTQKMLFESGRITFFPSTRMISFLGFTLMPGSDVSFPFTTTLPSRICIFKVRTFSAFKTGLRLYSHNSL